MGIPSQSQKVSLFVGMLSGNIDNFSAAGKALSLKYGPIDFESDIFDFNQSEYYRDEMGCALKRQFFGFRDMLDLEHICDIKLFTNDLETQFTKDGKRSVNIDPGYLDFAKVALLSTKDYTHRIYLDKGIYAEVTLFYKDKRFNPWPWTYPDYKSESYLKVFEHIRGLYCQKRNAC